MKTRMAVAAGTLLFGLGARIVADDARTVPAWSLIVENGESRRAVRLDTGSVDDVKVGVGRLAAAEPIPGEKRTITSIGSPDRTRILYEMTSGTPKQNHIIVVADADGKNFRTIADSGHSMRPAWSPDGKQVAFVSQRAGDVCHVYRIDADGRNERQISREPVERACRPGFTADGRVVFTIDRGRDGKIPLADLVIGDGDKETVLMKRQFVIYATPTADGARLAVIVPGELLIHDLKSGAVQKFPMKDVDPSWRVTYSRLLWRPDGRALAVSFGFLGGKEGIVHLPGEDHVGVLALDAGKPAVARYRVGDGYGLYAWVTDADLQRRK